MQQALQKKGPMAAFLAIAIKNVAIERFGL